MLLAQALVEHSVLDSMVSTIWSALTLVDDYVGEGNTKWLLLALAVVMVILLKPKR